MFKRFLTLLLLCSLCFRRLGAIRKETNFVIFKKLWHFCWGTRAWAWLTLSIWDLSSWNRHQTHVLSIGRKILNLGTTREVPVIFFHAFSHLLTISINLNKFVCFIIHEKYPSPSSLLFWLSSLVCYFFPSDLLEDHFVIHRSFLKLLNTVTWLYSMSK